MMIEFLSIGVLECCKMYYVRGYYGGDKKKVRKIVISATGIFRFVIKNTFWQRPNKILMKYMPTVSKPKLYLEWNMTQTVDSAGGERLCVRRKTDSPPPVNKILRVLPLALQSLNPIPGPSSRTSIFSEGRASERDVAYFAKVESAFLCLLSSGYTFLASVLRTEYQFTRGTFSTLLLLPASTFVVEYGHPLVPIF